MSLFANDDNHSLMGERITTCDSVKIAYDDLRIVNSKLIELELEKRINTNLRQVIHNDSIIIKDYTELNDRINKDYKRAINQRNVTIGIAGTLFVVGSILLLVK